MLISSSSRFGAAVLQKVPVQRPLLARRFLHGRLPATVVTTEPICVTLFCSWGFQSDERRKHHNRNVYQRALPQYVPTSRLALPQLRYFSTTKHSAEQASYRERFKERATHMRERASHMRESARDSYKEFREHPGQSMRSGAKSFSGMVKKYGPVFVGTYFGVYLSTLGGLFACVQSGLLDPAYLLSLFGHVDAGETKNTVDLVVEWMRNHSVTEPYAPFMEKNPYLANLAVAWIAVKFTEPIRMAVALGLTPRVSRWLGYTTHKDEEEEEEEVAGDSTEFSREDVSATTRGSTVGPKSQEDKKFTDVDKKV